MIPAYLATRAKRSMLQTLFHIRDRDPVFGLPVFGVGLALAVLAAGTLMALIYLWRTQRSLKAAWDFLPMVGLMAAAVVFLLPTLLDPEGLPIRGYGVMMLLGIVCGVALAAWRAPAARFDPEVIYSLAFWFFVCGIAGGRLFHIIEYWGRYRQPTLGATLAAIVNIPRGGLVVYGALILTLVMIPIFVRYHRLPGLALCDLVAPSMVLGLALGRVGCLLNGCCFGGVSDVPWSITFPADSPPYRDQRDQGELADVVLAENNGRVVVERIVSEAARSAGLKPGDEIAGISGKLEDSTLMLRLGTKPKIELVPPEKSFDPKIKDSLPRDAKPGLSRDVEEWLEKHEKLLESGKPNKRLLAAQDTLQALSYPNIAVDTADGRHVAWKLPARSLPVQPAQIYSTVDALLICIFLLAYYPYRRRDGEVLALMLTIYPVTRFLIEIIRVDEAGQFGTKLSISQWVSMGVLAGVAVLWVYVLRQPKGQLWANGG